MTAAPFTATRWRSTPTARSSAQRPEWKYGPACVLVDSDGWDGGPRHARRHFSYAVAVNDSGQIVGYSTTPGNLADHPFLWTAAGGMVDLGTFGGTLTAATAVNANGQVVGQSYFGGNSSARVLMDPGWRNGGPRHPGRELQRRCRGH